MIEIIIKALAQIKSKDENIKIAKGKYLLPDSLYGFIKVLKNQ